MSQVNREVCLRLIKLGHELTLIPPRAGRAAVRRFSGDEVLEIASTEGSAARSPPMFDMSGRRRLCRRSRAIGLSSSPGSSAASRGRWVLPDVDGGGRGLGLQQFVRDSYIAGGVPADRVHVVPLGVDQERFHPEARPFPLKTRKPFKFLFVGGTIHRKGIDILLQAYAETFTADDPVCLVIKDIGGASFYRGQTAVNAIGELRADPPHSRDRVP